MNLKKLLAAASVVALSATSAHAVTVAVTGPTSAPVPALQLDTVQPNANTGTLAFTVSPPTGTTFPGGIVLVQIDLPSGSVFAAAPQNTDAVGVGGGAATSTVQSGGAVGTGTVTYSVDFTSAGGTAINLSGLDLKFNGCPAGVTPLTVNASQGGQAIGTAGTDKDALAACKTAFGTTITANATTEIAGPAFTSLSNPQLGTVNYAIDAAVDRSYAGTPLDATDVTSATFTINFEDATAFATLGYQLTGGNRLAGVKSGNTFTFTATSAADVADLLDGTADSVDAATAAGNTTKLSAQTITVGTATLTLNDTNANFLPTTTVAGGTLKQLRRQGTATGVFDWNSSSTTNSVYRVTGLPKTGTTGYSITLSNTQPVEAAGTYDGGTITSTDGETVLTSFTKFGVPSVPDFRRADVSFNFEVTTGTLDVDRLLLRSNTLSSFGNTVSVED